jgi:uncharacterized membrane protein
MKYISIKDYSDCVNVITIIDLKYLYWMVSQKWVVECWLRFDINAVESVTVLHLRICTWSMIIWKQFIQTTNLKIITWSYNTWIVLDIVVVWCFVPLGFTSFPFSLPTTPRTVMKHIRNKICVCSLIVFISQQLDLVSISSPHRNSRYIGVYI